VHARARLHAQAGEIAVYWYFDTPKGRCRIAQAPDGRYHALFRDENLGNYATPQQALDELLGGHTFTHSSGIDTADLGLPDDLSEWTLVRGAP
jgi:hypothetical protein